MTKQRKDEKQDPPFQKTENERVGHPDKKRQIQNRLGKLRVSHSPQGGEVDSQGVTRGKAGNAPSAPGNRRRGSNRSAFGRNEFREVDELRILNRHGRIEEAGPPRPPGVATRMCHAAGKSGSASGEVVSVRASRLVLKV
jgi:hypothetical protein